MKKCPFGTHHIYRQEFMCQKDVKCEEYQTNITKCEKKLDILLTSKTVFINHVIVLAKLVMQQVIFIIKIV